MKTVSETGDELSVLARDPIPLAPDVAPGTVNITDSAQPPVLECGVGSDRHSGVLTSGLALQLPTKLFPPTWPLK